MQGFNIIAYVDAERTEGFDNPLNIAKTVSSWAPTRKQARSKKREMEQEYGGIVRIKSRA